MPLGNISNTTTQSEITKALKTGSLIPVKKSGGAKARFNVENGSVGCYVTTTEMLLDRWLHWPVSVKLF